MNVNAIVRLSRRKNSIVWFHTFPEKNNFLDSSNGLVDVQSNRFECLYVWCTLFQVRGKNIFCLPSIWTTCCRQRILLICSLATNRFDVERLKHNMRAFSQAKRRMWYSDVCVYRRVGTRIRYDALLIFHLFTGQDFVGIFFSFIFERKLLSTAFRTVFDAVQYNFDNRDCWTKMNRTKKPK